MRLRSQWLFSTVILMPFFKVQSSKFKVKNYKIKRYENNPSFVYVSKKGFTLIELLVVMAVIGILSAIMLANYNNFGERQEVKNAASELKSELRKYQTYAIAGQKNPNPSQPDCNGSSHSVDFYTVVFDASVSPPTYTVSLSCDSGGVIVPIASTVPWSGAATIEQVGCFDGTTYTSTETVDIHFRPLNYGLNLECPNGTAATAGSSVYIRISNPSHSATYNIYVTPSGDIYETH